MLERLADIGMALAEEIGARNVDAPYHPEPRHDPSRAFAAVSRAVRLTLVLAARMDADILAMRNDELVLDRVVGDGGPAFVGPKPAPPGSDCAPVFEDSSCYRRAKVRDAVWEVIDHEIGDGDVALGARSRVNERLIESEDYDAVLSLPWRDCVAAICADLGLSPNWSRWSDEEGFARDETRSACPATWPMNAIAPHSLSPDEGRGSAYGMATPSPHDLGPDLRRESGLQTERLAGADLEQDRIRRSE